MYKRQKKIWQKIRQNTAKIRQKIRQKKYVVDQKYQKSAIYETRIRKILKNCQLSRLDSIMRGKKNEEMGKKEK